MQRLMDPTQYNEKDPTMITHPLPIHRISPDKKNDFVPPLMSPSSVETLTRTFRRQTSAASNMSTSPRANMMAHSTPPPLSLQRARSGSSPEAPESKPKRKRSTVNPVKRLLMASGISSASTEPSHEECIESIRTVDPLELEKALKAVEEDGTKNPAAPTSDEKRKMERLRHHIQANRSKHMSESNARRSRRFSWDLRGLKDSSKEMRLAMQNEREADVAAVKAAATSQPSLLRDDSLYAFF